MAQLSVSDSGQSAFAQMQNIDASMRLIFENSPNLYVLLDRDTNILYHSQEFFRLMKSTESDSCVGKPLCSVHMRFKDADFVGRSLKRFARAISGEDNVAEVDTIEWPIGEKCSYRISYSRINDENGNLSTLMIALSDVTDIWCMEADRQMQETLEATQLPCMMWDENGHVMGRNKEFLRVFGIPEDMSFDQINACIEPKYQPDGRSSDDAKDELIREGLKSGLARVCSNLQRFDGTPVYFGVSVVRVAGPCSQRLFVYFHDLTEARSQESEERTRLMLDSSPLLCILRDEFNHVIDCNQETLNAFGLRQKTELFGDLRRFYPVLQPDGRSSHDESREHWNNLTEEHPTCDFEWTFRTLTGEFIPVETKLVRIPWKDSFRVLSYHRDLRETKKILAESSEANERIQLMLDSNPLICILRDDDNNIIDCNLAALVAFGVADKAELCRRFKELYTEFQPGGTRSVDDIPVIRDKLAQTGFISNYEWTYQTATGEPLPAEVTLVRIPWKDTYRVLSYARDMRETQKIIAEKDEVHERMRTMLDGNPLMCLLHDENRDLIDCNQEALNLFNLAKKSDFAKDMREICPEFQADGRTTEEAINQVFEIAQTTGACRNFEWTLQTKMGELLPVEATLVRIPWRNTYRYLSYSRDLREVRERELQFLESMEQNLKLEEQRRAAQAASNAKSQFLASMSHEIRTPMNVIIGLLDLMRTDNLDTGQVKAITDVKQTSEVLLHIINDILDFHKIESDKLDLIPIHFDLNTLCTNVASRHQFLAVSKGLKFSSSFAPNLPATVFGDERRLTQILTNLLSNAVKYTRKGSVNFTVDSAVEDGKKYLAFTVEDTGIGIEEKNLSLLFEKFEQFDQQKNRGIIGTGLGLSITKSLVEMMDGQIRVQSEYGKGSQFTVLLPFVKGNPSKIRRMVEAAQVQAVPGTKVLVVDDNAGNISVVMGLLARHNIYPDTVCNGKEAVEMIRTQRYDLVFMDHMMPEMDGVEATALIRKMDGKYYQELPIVALSANVISSAQELFLQCGMNDFLAKPIIGSALNQMLARWLPTKKITTKKTEPKPVATPLDGAILNKRLQGLAKIEELRISIGLSRLDGDKKLYIDILRQFCSSVEEDIDVLKKSIQSGDWKMYTIRIHTVKSGLAMIGNQALSDWAHSLEDASAQGNTAKCRKENGKFCTALLKFRTKLLSAGLMLEDAPGFKKRKISAKVLKKELEFLLLACKDFRAETAEPKAEKLLSVTHSDPMDALLTKIHGLISTFDYDKAVKVIVESMESL